MGRRRGRRGHHLAQRPRGHRATAPSSPAGGLPIGHAPAPRPARCRATRISCLGIPFATTGPRVGGRVQQSCADESIREPPGIELIGSVLQLPSAGTAALPKCLARDREVTQNRASRRIRSIAGSSILTPSTNATATWLAASISCSRSRNIVGTVGPVRELIGVPLPRGSSAWELCRRWRASSSMAVGQPRDLAALFGCRLRAMSRRSCRR